MYFKFLLVASTMMAPVTAYADTNVILQGALQSGGSYYTNNLGQVVVTTGGGSAPNIGDSSGKNDDGFSGPIDLGFNVSIFGSSYSSLFINNNGNVSFGNGISAFVPTGPTGVDAPIISPWFADVDTRGQLSGVAHYQLDTAGQLVVTWDNVGYFSGGDDLLNSFQLVLRGDNFAVPSGEGQIGFFYKTMDWINTSTSDLAAIGFGDGAGNATVLNGSNMQANLNDVAENHFIWFNQNLEPVPPTNAVPELGTWAMMLLGFGAIGTALRRPRRKFATTKYEMGSPRKQAMLT